MYWERYHCEVVYACLLASRPSRERHLAVEQITNRVDRLEQACNEGETPIEDLIRLDREIHLCVCRYGTPDVHPMNSVQKLERAFNRLNAATPEDATRRRYPAVLQEHREIINAYEQIGKFPTRECFRRLLEAYGTHLFPEGTESMILTDSFRAQFEASVLREVEAMECIDASRLFESLHTLIWVSKDVVPLEWGEDCFLDEAIAKSVVSGSVLIYLSDSQQSLPEDLYEVFVNRVARQVFSIGEKSAFQGSFFDLHRKSLVAGDKLDLLLIREILEHCIFRILIENHTSNEFWAETASSNSQALYLYDPKSFLDHQLTRRRGITPAKVGEIERKVELSVNEIQVFWLGVRELLQGIPVGHPHHQIAKSAMRSMLVPPSNSQVGEA